MNRYAWLDFDGGTWCLLTDSSENSSRTWADKSAALCELAEEGWKISGPFPKRLDLDPESIHGPYGFILCRAVQ